MRYFLVFTSAFFLCAIFWIVLVFAQSKNPTKTSQWIYDVYEKKLDIASKIEGRKIVLVSGSNAMFGIDSKMIESAFGIPTVNLGVNAGIEPPLILYLAKKVIKRGDIVVMPLEYNMYLYDGEVAMQAIDYILSREPWFFWDLSLKEKFYLLWKIDLKRVLEGYFDKSTSKVRGYLFGYEKIDDKGDQIQSSIKDREEIYFNNIFTEAEDYANEFKKKDSLGFEYLKDFSKWAKENGVTIYVVPTTILVNDRYLKEDRWFYESISDILRESNIEFVGNVFDYMYQKKYYFDTNYHLVSEAREFRTKKLIEDLKEHIK